jgi:hypothetical protein
LEFQIEAVRYRISDSAAYSSSSYSSYRRDTAILTAPTEFYKSDDANVSTVLFILIAPEEVVTDLI